MAIAEGGNDIPVVAFGSAICTRANGTTYSCNLHSVWDSILVDHHQLSDREYVDELARQIGSNWDRVATGSLAEWAMESHELAKTALLPEQGVVDDAYYRAQIANVDKRLALAGVRLAAVLNDTLTFAPRP